MSEQRHDAHIGQVDVDVANSMMECLCPNESVFDFFLGVSQQYLMSVECLTRVGSIR